MGPFDAILRVRKWELDEQRRDLRVQQDALAKIDGSLKDIEDSVIDAEKGADPMISAVSLGAFLDGARKKKEALMSRRAHQQKEVERHQVLVQKAFQDLKTIEIAAEQEVHRRALELSRQEQAELDEIALRLRVQPDDQLD